MGIDGRRAPMKSNKRPSQKVATTEPGSLMEPLKIHLSQLRRTIFIARTSGRLRTSTQSQGMIGSDSIWTTYPLPLPGTTCSAHFQTSGEFHVDPQGLSRSVLSNLARFQTEARIWSACNRSPYKLTRITVQRVRATLSSLGGAIFLPSPNEFMSPFAGGNILNYITID